MKEAIQKKILFLHGFFATGSCAMAKTLRDAFEGSAVVLTPDLPLHPKEALDKIRSIIDKERPDLLLGNSCGAFLAQMLAPVVGIPALLGNPHFRMTEFLKPRFGEHEYKAPRMDGNQRLAIDEALIDEFAELEALQFDCCSPYYKDRVWGLFGERDNIAHFCPLFLQHYDNAFRFPGGHTPTEQEVMTWYVPLAKKMLMEYSAKEERFFQHFKGGKRNGKPSVKFSFGSKTDNPFGGQLVKVSYMDEEKSMKGEAPSNFVKNRIVITPPSGMTVEQFDEMVIKTGNSFGNNPNITYCLEPFEQTQGNCNSSSSTLLYKAGVPLSRIKDLRKQISGLVWGFGDIKPWTVEEQSKAVQRQREFDQLRNEMMNTIILNKY